MFENTWCVCAFISPSPTRLPSASSATCPAANASRLPVATIVWLYVKRGGEFVGIDGRQCHGASSRSGRAVVGGEIEVVEFSSGGKHGGVAVGFASFDGDMAGGEVGDVTAMAVVS